MKNTNSKYTEVIVDYLKANPGATLDGIKEGNPKVSEVMVRKVLKDLQKESLITVNDEDGGFMFVTGKKEANVADPIDEKKTDKKSNAKKSEEEDMGPATQSGRDNRKFDFLEYKALSKGKLALAVIRQYVKDNNSKITLIKLQEAFDSSAIQPRFQICEEIGKARKHTVNKRERYFFNEADIIKLGNQRVVVTNQWGLSTILPLISIAQKKMKYKITVSK